MRLLLFSVFLLICSSVAAQNVKIKGVIVDSLSSSPEVAAIVQFYKVDDSSKPVAFTTTEENGAFAHSLSQKGQYRLLLHNLGKKDKAIEFVVGDSPEVDLGVILVQDDAQTLSAGTVTALSKLVVIDSDKITYKVQDDIESKTRSVLDILRKIPLVSVDASERINVNGNSTFLVYVNGIKNQMMSDNPTEVFRAMPANMVLNIEVVTDPGARYDAEGVGAVLNITTISRGDNKEKKEDFYNGSLSLGGSTRRYNGGVFMTAMKDKWTVSMNLNRLKVWSPSNIHYTERTSDAGTTQMKTISSGVSDNISANIFADISASYEINKYNLLSLSAGLMDVASRDWKNLSSSIGLSSSMYQYDEHTYSTMRLKAYNANLDYQHLWKNNPGRLFVLSYQVSGRPLNNVAENSYTAVSELPSSLNDRRNDGFSNSTTHTLQADFQTRFAKDHMLSTGAKMMFRHNLSNYDVLHLIEDAYVSDDAGTVNYDFYNNIGALFAEYSGKFKKFRLRAGARYEHTWQKAMYNDVDSKDFSLDYDNLVPSGSIQYNINQFKNIGLVYSMSIRRPGITYLNPYVDASDPSSKVYGNPDLKSERGHKLEFSYNQMGTKWMLTMRLSQTLRNKGISQYMFYDQNNILNTTYGNIINGSLTALNSYISWNPVQKTKLIFNGQMGFNVFESEKLDLRTKGWTYNMMTMVEQILPSAFVLSANLSYLPNRISLQGTTSGIWDASLSLSKGFLDDKLNVRLQGRTHIGRHGGALMSTLYHGKDFIVKDDITMLWRDIYIDLSYSFGNNDRIQVKKSRRKKSANDQLELE